MRVLKKKLTHDLETFQPKLHVTLEFDLELAEYEEYTTHLDPEIGDELLKMILATETEYPEYYRAEKHFGLEE